MVFSTNVGDGEDTLATQYNNLRLDVLDATAGHDHDGTASGGKKVGHGNLVDGAISGTYLTHSIINKHVQGTGTSSDPDAGIGGSYGVHELVAGAKVAGSFGGRHYFQSGSATLSGGVKVVAFSATFASIPIVVATYAQARTFDPGNPSEASDIYVHDISTTAFTCRASDSQFGSAKFNWIAVDSA